MITLFFFLFFQRLKDDVKDSKDSKLSDPFYDSLEGLLSDLKAVTVVCGSVLSLSLSPLKV